MKSNKLLFIVIFFLFLFSQIFSLKTIKNKNIQKLNKINTNNFPHLYENISWFSDEPLNYSKITKFNSEWMSKLSDNLNISNITIPGTHDSCTFEFFFDDIEIIEDIIDFFGMTQSWNFTEQLYAGIRYFDIRVGSDGLIYHGLLLTTTSFLDVFNEIKNFFKKNPKESIIMRIKYEVVFSCYYDEEKCFENNIKKILDENENILFTENYIPLLKEIRGKVFIIMEDKEYKNCLNWKSNKLKIQDYYNLSGEQEKAIQMKKQFILKYFNLSLNENNFLYINHCSAVAFYSLMSIKYVAMRINEIPFFYKKYKGIIPLDFPSEELVLKIINQNF